MLGAIIGDTVGSVYEFNNKRSKDFDLFTDHSKLTDDSIMSLAVCECLLNREANKSEKIISYLKKWGHAYPDRGYGGRFYNWLFSKNDKPYNSFGNGAAMRISAVGWYGRSEEEVKELAYNLTAVTHNHPEGLKGAEVTAMCVYYARIGKSKEFIKEYVSKYYNLDFDYEDLKKNYWFNETCQDSVPQAIYCFLISTDFEDCLRTTISIGGDCDTTSAISCAIAEAYYKYIDPDLVRQVIKRLPKAKAGCNPKNVLMQFLSDKTYYSSEDEIIRDDSYSLGIERIEKNKRYIEFICSKALQPIAERFAYHEMDYYFGSEEDQLSKDCLADLNLEQYFDVLSTCYFSEKPFDLVKTKIRELLSCSDFERFKQIFTELAKLSNELCSTDDEFRLLMFENSKEAFHYLEENYDIQNTVYNEVFTKPHKVDRLLKE